MALGCPLNGLKEDSKGWLEAGPKLSNAILERLQGYPVL
jgi:hypothetical protein